MYMHKSGSQLSHIRRELGRDKLNGTPFYSHVFAACGRGSRDGKPVLTKELPMGHRLCPHCKKEVTA